ncbi:MAG TPA: glycosyltransferase family 39 protein [Phnomibacter sp.]|nr:glycosyltransferase family 39 protein [Phnomibacter sp.]
MFWLLLASAGLLLLARLGAAPVYILDEAKNAQCAREMFLRNDWVVPTFNGELRTDKPALHYWFMIISFKAFGVGEWQARIFSALAGLGTIFSTFYFVRRHANAVVGFFASLALVLSTHFLFEFRLAVPDPYLIFFTTLGLFAGFTWLQEKKWKWLLLASGSLALATLAKGPVALGLPGICLLICIVWQRQWWVFKDWRLLLAGLFYILLAAPWYYAVHQRTQGAFTNGFFLEHNINRFSSEMEGHGGPFFITLLIVLLGLLPFTVFIVNATKRIFKPQLPPIVFFGAVVAIVYVVFFSISSTKLPNYPMPCYPFAGLVLGYFISDFVQRRTSLPNYGWLVLLVIGVALSAGGFFALQLEKELADLKWLSLGLMVLPVGMIVLWLRFRQSAARSVLALSGTYFLFNAYVLWVAYPMVYQRNPVTVLAKDIQSTRAVLVAYKDYNAAFNFNLPPGDLPLTVFFNADQLALFCMSQEQGKDILIICRTDKLEELNKLGAREVKRHRDLFEIPTTVLLRFSPGKDF